VVPQKQAATEVAICDFLRLTPGIPAAKVGPYSLNHQPFMPKATKASPAPIEHHIRIVRGQKVMLDNDLAALYGVSTGALNQAVRRNLDRFPQDFMFTLTKEEAGNLKSQTVISSWGGRRKPPFAFTEHGVAMLSAVLRSERAVAMSIAIIRAFVRLREMLVANKDLAARVEKLERGQGQISSIIEVLVNEIEHMKALPPPNKRKIGFDL